MAQRVVVQCGPVPVSIEGFSDDCSSGCGPAVFVLPGTTTVGVAERVRVVDGACTLDEVVAGGHSFGLATLGHDGFLVDGAPVGASRQPRGGVAGAAAGVRPTAGFDAKAGALVPLTYRRAVTAEAGGGPWGASGALELRDRTQVSSRLDLAADGGRLRYLVSGAERVPLGDHVAVTFDGDMGGRRDRALLSLSHGRALRQDPYAHIALVATGGPAGLSLAYRGERGAGSRFDGVDIDAVVAGVGGTVRPSAEFAATAGSAGNATLTGAGARTLWEAPIRLDRLHVVPRLDGRVASEARHATGTRDAADAEHVVGALGGLVQVAIVRARAGDLWIVGDAEWSTAVRNGEPLEPGIFAVPTDGVRATTGLVGGFGGDLAGTGELLVDLRDATRVWTARAAVDGGSWSAAGGLSGDLASQRPVDRGELSGRIIGDAVEVGVTYVRTVGTELTARLGPAPLRAARDRLPHGDALRLDCVATAGPMRADASLAWSPRTSQPPLGAVARVDMATRNPELGLFALGGAVLDVGEAAFLAGVRLGDHPPLSWAHTR